MSDAGIAETVARLAEERDHCADRAADLEALARDMLSRFVRTSDGHRARVGQVQIARWEKQLGGGGGD